MVTFTQLFTLTSQSASAVVDTRPQRVKNLGFNTVAFFDDFTAGLNVPNGITTSYTPQTGFNWYPANNSNYILTSPSNLEVRTTALASSVATSNANASSTGGILVMYGANFTGSIANQLQSVPFGPNNGSGSGYQYSANPGGRFWKHAYFETYMYYNPSGPISWTPSAMAWWSFPVTTDTSANGPEVDFFEQGTPGGVQGDAVQVLNTPTSPTPPHFNFLWPTTTNQWHLWGALWESTGIGTGQWSCWYDGVQITPIQNGSAAFITTGITQAGVAQMIPNGENGNGLGMIIGNGWGNTPMFMDWVRVWQAP